jgi:protein-export chaperone SecB
MPVLAREPIPNLTHPKDTFSMAEEEKDDGIVLTKLDTPPEAPEGGNGADTLPVAGLLSQYIKDLSVENPKAPESFQWTEPPQIDVQFNIAARQVNDEVSEIELKISASAKTGQGTAYIVELAYCGLVGMRNMTDDQKHALRVHVRRGAADPVPLRAPGGRRRGARRGLRAAAARSDRLQRALLLAARAAPGPAGGRGTPGWRRLTFAGP